MINYTSYSYEKWHYLVISTKNELCSIYVQKLTKLNLTYLCSFTSPFIAIIIDVKTIVVALFVRRSKLPHRELKTDGHWRSFIVDLELRRL